MDINMSAFNPSQSCCKMLIERFSNHLNDHRRSYENFLLLVDFNMTPKDSKYKTSVILITQIIQLKNLNTLRETKSSFIWSLELFSTDFHALTTIIMNELMLNATLKLNLIEITKILIMIYLEYTQKMVSETPLAQHQPILKGYF